MRKRHAFGVPARAVEEADPARVRPAPHCAGADASRHLRVENGDGRGVGAQDPRSARALLDLLRHWLEEINRRADAATERLRRDVDASSRKPRRLSLDGRMLDVLVADGLDEQRVTELTALDDASCRLSTDRRVVMGTGDGLVLLLHHDDLCRDDIEVLAAEREAHRLHLGAADRALALVPRHLIVALDAPEMCRQLAASRMVVALLRSRTALGLHERRPEDRKHELPLEPLECLGGRALTLEVSDLLRQVEVDVAHPLEEHDDRRDDLDEESRRELLREPPTHLLEVGRVRRRDRWLRRRRLAAHRPFSTTDDRAMDSIRSDRKFDHGSLRPRLPARTPLCAAKIQTLDDQPELGRFNGLDRQATVP